MDHPRQIGQRRRGPGLCGGCVHARVIENDRGSAFLLCRAAKTCPDLPKYPPLPVLRCPAFEPVPTGPSAPTDPA